MSTTKNNKLARTLKILLDILFGLSVVAGVGLLVWTALAPLVLRQSDVYGTVMVPVRIGTGDEPQFDVRFKSAAQDNINEAFVEEAGGTLVITTTDALPVVIANAAKLVLITGLVYIVHLIRSVVSKIQDGDPFAEQNVTQIRRMGFMVLLMGFLSPVVQFLAANEIIRQLPVMVPALQAGPTFDARIMLVSLFILLLAQIWSSGIELQRDSALTI